MVELKGKNTHLLTHLMISDVNDRTSGDWVDASCYRPPISSPPLFVPLHIVPYVRTYARTDGGTESGLPAFKRAQWPQRTGPAQVGSSGYFGENRIMVIGKPLRTWILRSGLGT